MTVSSSLAKTVHLTNERIREYAFNFKTFKAAELSVSVIGSSGREPEQLIWKADYTVSGLDSNNGGAIHLTERGQSRAGHGRRLVILRNMPFIQDVDYRPHDVFPAETHERALDIAAMERQELREKIARAVLAPPDQDQAASYEEIVAMKEGPAGPMGPQGPAGIPGAPGPMGPQGPAGTAPTVDIIDCGGPVEKWAVIIDGGTEN